MDRRTFLLLAAAHAPLSLPRASGSSAAGLLSLDDALRWLDRLERSGNARATGAWPLVAVFDHLAQSIEMSLDGFPRSKGMLFHQTVGVAARTVFRLRGRMHHPLDQPIPGAPPLAFDREWRASAVRLRVAIRRFGAHRGPLAPHFAYGALDRGEYFLVHTWHIADHRAEVVNG